MEEETELPKSNDSKSTFWKDSNRLLSFSAIFISAVTLFILMYQTSLASKQFDLEQKQQLASVMPYLQIATSYMSSEEFTITVENLGIGPAFIKNVRMHYKDSIYENIDYPQFYEILKYQENYDGERYLYSNLMAGFVIPANRQIEHMNINKGDRLNIWNDIFISDDNEIEIEIEYASIYDERWVVRGLFNEPVKVKSIED